jgi:hypothetical protein
VIVVFPFAGNRQAKIDFAIRKSYHRCKSIINKNAPQCCEAFFNLMCFYLFVFVTFYLINHGFHG